MKPIFGGDRSNNQEIRLGINAIPLLKSSIWQEIAPLSYKLLYITELVIIVAGLTTTADCGIAIACYFRDWKAADQLAELMPWGNKEAPYSRR